MPGLLSHVNPGTGRIQDMAASLAVANLALSNSLPDARGGVAEKNTISENCASCFPVRNLFLVLLLLSEQTRETHFF